MCWYNFDHATKPHALTKINIWNWCFTPLCLPFIHCIYTYMQYTGDFSDEVLQNENYNSLLLRLGTSSHLPLHAFSIGQGSTVNTPHVCPSRALQWEATWTQLCYSWSWSWCVIHTSWTCHWKWKNLDNYILVVCCNVTRGSFFTSLCTHALPWVRF